MQLHSGPRLLLHATGFRRLGGQPRKRPVRTTTDGTQPRKADHVRINLEHDVAAKGVGAGFDGFRFIPRALPEIDRDEVDTHRRYFGRTLSAPILISSMTGGTAEAERINGTLAEVAQDTGFAMGLGSGRALLEHPELLPTFDVRSRAPDVLLLANLGAVQLNLGYGSSDCRRLVELLHADALVLHLNAIQEALQPEGDTQFRGLLDKIKIVCAELTVPVIVKEVGWGIDPEAVRALFDAGAAAVDVAGAGGTSWSEVERHRIAQPWRAQAAAEFAGWGIPTAECLIAARRAVPEKMLIASGGVRGGLDVAKAIALGADLVGVASPFLHAAAQGRDAAGALAKELDEVLRTAMFAIGEATIARLQRTPRLRRLEDRL